MKEKIVDKRIEFKKKLLEIGCDHITAQLIAVEAGGSQKIVDIDYLNSLELNKVLLKNSIKCVQQFYLDELGLI